MKIAQYQFYIMNTGLITICNVLPTQSGAVPSAPSSAPKNAQNAADNVTSTENSSDNNSPKARNTPSDKNGQSFDEALREKMDSQLVDQEVCDDKKKNQQDLEPANPDLAVLVLPSSAGLLDPQPATTDNAEPLELSSNPSTADVTHGLRIAKNTEPLSNTMVTGDPLAASVPASAESAPTAPILTDQNIEQTIATPIPQMPTGNTKIPVDFGQDTSQTVPTPISQIPIGNTQAPVEIGLPADAKDSTALEKPEIPSPLPVVAAQIQTAKTSPIPPNIETSLPIGNFTDLVENASQPNTTPKQQNLSQGLEESSISPISSQSSPVQTNNPAVQLAALQTESRKNTPSGKEDVFTSLESVGQPFDSTINQASANQQTLLSPNADKIGINTDSGFHLGRQIQESVSSTYHPGTKQILIRLDPPELGKITIRFIERPEGITGLLQVDNPRTQKEIQQSLPGIIQTLQNADVQIKKIEVVLSNQQDSNAFGGQSAGHNGGFGQESPQYPHSMGQTPSYNQWRSNPQHLNDPASPQAVWADNSIDMLI